MARHPRATIRAHAGSRGDRQSRRGARARARSAASSPRSRASARPLDAAALAGDPPDADALVAAPARRAPSRAPSSRAPGVLERLASFVGVVRAARRARGRARGHRRPRVPNDAFADAAASARSAWGEGAVAELRGLLPADHVAFAPASRCAAPRSCPPAAAAELTVARRGRCARRPCRPGFVLAFGPRAQRGWRPRAAVGAADLSAERAARARADGRARGPARARRRARRAAAARARQRRQPAESAA